MKPENYDIVRQLLQEFQVYKIMDNPIEKEWIYNPCPDISSIGFEINTLGEPLATALNQVTRTLWLRHNISSIWYVSASKDPGKIRISIS